MINGYGSVDDFDHLIDLVNSHITMMALAPTKNYLGSNVCYGGGHVVLNSPVDKSVITEQKINVYRVSFNYKLKLHKRMFITVRDGNGFVPSLKVATSKRTFNDDSHADSILDSIENIIGGCWQGQADSMVLFTGDARYVDVKRAFIELMKYIYEIEDVS